MIFSESVDSYQFDYRDSFKYFCLKNCVRQLLSVYIEDAFAYINCVPCIYIYFSDQLPDGYTIRYNKNPMHKAYESFFITVEPKQKCAKINFKSILKTIDKQKPVIAATDDFYLPYKQHYNKYHASHAIIIHEYDDIHKNIRVIDCYDRDNYHGILSYDDFFASWSSANPSEANPFSGSPINNVWSYIEPINVEKKSAELVKDTLINTIGFFHGRNGKLCFVGLDGLVYLKKLLEYKVINGIDINVERLHKSLYMYFREKILFKDYLSFHSHCIKSIDMILASLEKNLFSWNIFLAYVLKLSVLNKVITLNKFSALFEDIIFTEEQFYDSLLNVIK